MSAALNSDCASGSARHSLTPARMPSSISAGSSVAATSITFVFGCCFLRSGSSDGIRRLPRTSISRTSGLHGVRVERVGNIRDPRGCDRQPGGADQLLEPRVTRTDDGQGYSHESLTQRTRMMDRRNDALFGSDDDARAPSTGWS